MSTEFKSVALCKKYFAIRHKIDVKDFKSDDPILQRIIEVFNPKLKEDRTKEHHFKFFSQTEGKEIKVRISPYRSGFCGWTLLDSGYYIRFNL